MKHKDDIPIAHWSIKLNIDCPCCGQYVNLLDNYENAESIEPGEANDGEVQSVACPHCGGEFECKLSWSC